MDITEVIDELEREFVNSKNFLWSKKTLVNMEKCATLISELKAKLPAAIQEANYIISKRDQIMNNANAQAKQITAEAEFRAQQMVSSSEIYKRSERESREVIKHAKAKCNELYGITRDNIDKLLMEVEKSLNQDLSMVKINRQELEIKIQKMQSEDFLNKNTDQNKA